jgi:hypothetical protein
MNMGIMESLFNNRKDVLLLVLIMDFVVGTYDDQNVRLKNYGIAIA